MKRAVGRVSCLLACGILLVLGLLWLTDGSPREGLSDYSRVEQSQPGSAASTADSAGSDRAAKRAFYEKLTPDQQARVVKLKNRWLVPGAVEAFSQKDGREQVLVQFKRWLTIAEKAKLAGRGLRLGAPFTGHSYRAVLEPEAWEEVKNYPDLEGIARSTAEDKLPEVLQRLVAGEEVHLPGLEVNGGALVAVEFVPGTVPSPPQFVRDRGWAPLRKGGVPNEIVVKVDVEDLRALALLPEVAYIHYVDDVPIAMDYDEEENDCDDPDEVVVPEPENEVAQGIHNVDDLHGVGYDLTGNGIATGQVDGGSALSTHEALTGHIVNVDADAAVHYHATHVAGTIVADPPVGKEQYEGMAPDATHYTYDWYSGINGVGTEQPQQKMQHAADTYGVVAHNNSWGYATGWTDGTWYDNQYKFGLYGSYSRNWDLAVASRSVVVCKSSGNERNDDGDGHPHDGTYYDVPGLTNPYFDCISYWGNAKNVITVGATNDDGSTITTFSSIGPCNDGRIKPEVVANGLGLWSTYNTSDTAYQPMSGTSMSTPVVTGISALVVEAYKDAHDEQAPAPMVVKALLVQTALDRGNTGPDYVFGFGLVDAKGAVDLLQADAGDATHILEDSVADTATEEYDIYIPASTSSWKVTLTWMDPAGSSGADPAIVNDLDLELVEPNGTTIHYPFKLDVDDPPADATNSGRNDVDTVEQAVVSSPTEGAWKIRVKGDSVPSGPQDFVVMSDISVDPGFPHPPVLIAPAGPVAGKRPTFSWRALGGAVKYVVRVYTDVGDQIRVLNVTGATSVQCDIDLVPGQAYTWRAAGVDAGNVVGTYSDHTAFSIIYLPAPEQIAPSGVVPDKRPVFSWEPVTGAVKYIVRVYDDGGTQLRVLQAVGTTSVQYDRDLVSGESYTWRICAVDEGNVSGSYSDHFGFGVLFIPVPQTPSGAVAGKRPTFDWNGVGGGASYIVRIYTDVGDQVRVMTVSGATSAPCDRDLIPGQSYTWRVCAVRADGARGQYSNPLAFSIINLAAPVQLTPSGPMAGVRPMFTWNPRAGASGYIVRIYTGGGAQVRVISVIGATSVQCDKDLVAGQAYTWRLCAVDSGGVTGQYTTPMAFSINDRLPAPVQTAPSGATPGGPRPVFSWNAVAGASRYIVRVYNDVGTQVRVISVTGATSVPCDRDLVLGLDHTWRVCAVDAGNLVGLYSAAEPFTPQP